MNRQKANLLNAVTLIFLSFWVYYDAVNQGIHQLFPMALGIMLLAMNQGIMLDNRAQIRVAMVITVLTLFFLVKMSCTTIEDDNMREGMFYLIMSGTSLISLVTFITARPVKSKR
ncbi:MAG TPA: hypothetical protein PK611_10810 [Saprospiraceae bacterium]|jgi:hypothetical protein|nr:hypothetical protein [Saprospiraceae bacterium]HRO08609.1 hypothetical protein [Saprospiraceae bacterium]HRO74153.1 hypothetical protein [Saprospiraceae bacterium]HRP41995.1 hypothetical protein [Saprospiraceae bacterium]